MAKDFTMLPGWQQEAVSVLRPKLNVLADEMLAGAHDDTPVDTGFLDDSNYSRVADDGTVILGNTADYALDVEFGHHIRRGDIPRKTAPSGFVEAQPFLRPQAYRNYGEI